MSEDDLDKPASEETNSSVSPEEGRQNHILLLNAFMRNLLDGVIANAEAAKSCIEAGNKAAAEECLKIIKHNLDGIPSALQELEEVRNDMDEASCMSEISRLIG